MPATIESIYRGKPKLLHDDRGEWLSSIDRDPVEGPIEILREGLVGDKVAQPYHGSLNAAVCVHLHDHYRFWSERYGVPLKPGVFGENFTLGGITEDDIFAGDIVRTGTALLQVSGPRVPCANLARHVGRPDWVKLTIRENRSGFYTRVLEPGIVRPGDPWQLQQRLNETASIPSINRCFYLDFDPAAARHILTLNGLGDWWKEQFQEKLEARQEHWSQTLTD
jgi:MOSC domain-containing protein YiiM